MYDSCLCYSAHLYDIISESLRHVTTHSEVLKKLHKLNFYFRLFLFVTFLVIQIFCLVEMESQRRIIVSSKGRFSDAYEVEENVSFI
jgi:hypothetical protein